MLCDPGTAEVIISGETPLPNENNDVNKGRDIGMTHMALQNLQFFSDVKCHKDCLVAYHTV